ncbi:YrhK family protein [Alicyclobacillus fastidiosus]|uniref:YrhK family protein n=1 Tax=Alicyclobacillus fastidiosus TaxID=392011 RepID=A0ABY6ZCV4_9BACL|nr:YrhK family protein [Alicyclobacillus fastidiosus]WAH40019.1 YrhK family protein [Alicyclobacillus fastidiosus]GMA61317.1 hypothetical protein GCM10025859_17570 [Alicyclobacillus fastidiosus]
MSKKDIEIKKGNEIIDVDFEQRKVVINERYEWLHIINDILLALWFIVGSIMFFYGRLVYWGTWLFLAGSVQMLIGPVIRVAQKIHLHRLKYFGQRIG